MMEIFDTYVYMKVARFFQGFWMDNAGRIFLTTFLAYSASYMIYSGYISWFAGGYGGLLLSQVGFTAIDFLALVPTSLLLLFESMKAFFKSLIRYTLIYIAFPFLLLSLLLIISTNWKTHSFKYGDTLALLGFSLWFIGAYLGLNLFEKYKRLSIPFAYLGTIIFSIYTPLFVEQTNTISSKPNLALDIVILIILEFMALLYLIIIAMLPFLAGQSMAKFATTEKLLSKLTKIVLKKSVQIPGMQLVQETVVETPVTGLSSFIALFKPQSKVETYTFTYEEVPNLPVYLIASFNRITAIYVSPEILNSERGKMIMVSNDLIYSMEVEGRKKSV